MDIVFEEQLFSVSDSDPIAVDIRAKGWLTTQSLSWFQAGLRKTLAFDDVVGVKPNHKTYPQGLVGFVLCTYPAPRTVPQRRQLREYEFVCPTEQMRSQWINAIRQALQGLPIQPQQAVKPRHLQILINPKGGRRQAKQVFQSIQPILEDAHCQMSILETQGGDRTIEAVRGFDLSAIDGFVVVGGDGTVYELINGLMTHADAEAAIAKPIGIIPAGTGNGLGKTILELSKETYDPRNAAFVIAKGQCQPINLGVVKQDGQQYYSILSLAWALISDIDIRSNKLRFLKFLGSLRSDVYAFLSILALRSYRGRISFLSAPDWTSRPDKPQHHPSQSQPTPALEKSPSSGWQVIEGEFVALWAMNVAWATHSVFAAPHAQLADGYMDVLIIRKGITRWRLLTAFLKIATGDHLSLPEMEYYKVRCLHLEPLSSQGLLAVDGEEIKYCSIEMNVLANHAQVFCR
ncbi:diacylglycerol kinase family protein [Acaryochloris sp. IP29b_bin.148]|uniref:diacylglycerol kinase family protein n=1 Tax=Acaryochloris sp. IP29b_bin.148 TaxID=2969218 RepID=UPI0026352DDC|nr:diacylglycerol kinase family protein [Acaryochloris sp. IP29b_bin.148]